MSRTKRDILDTETMLERLATTLQLHGTGNDCYEARADAESLRRISMTLHRWHELECGDGNDSASWCVVRGRKTPNENPQFQHDDAGDAFFEKHNYRVARDINGNYKTHTTYTRIPDREKGALTRLAAIMARYPSLTSYVQGDPRGCALYILTPEHLKGIPHDQLESYYSRGLAVHQ